MIQNKLSLLFLVLICIACEQQPLARFTITPAQTSGNRGQLVRVHLDSITNLPDSLLQLVKLDDHTTTPIPFQVEHVEDRVLIWFLQDQKDGEQQYELIHKKFSKDEFPQVQIENDKGAFTISSAGSNLLQYHSELVYPPAGVDSVFKRSGFIHPIWTPNSQVLTRIQPADHYHHYGIWNPWTHVLFEDDTVDFWNLYKKQGTVRFKKLLSTSIGSVYAGIKVELEHIVFKNDTTEKVALREFQTIRVTPVQEDKYFLVDIKIEMECATESPFHILEYRYGGLGWRATEEWNPQNSEVLTSENKTRKDADGSTARWCMVQGQFRNDKGGMVLLSHPENYNHPEPLRIWPEDSNGGEMFVNIAPTKFDDWLLNPHQAYTLQYRFVVFNGRFTPEEAALQWQQYVYSPTVEIQKF